MADKNELFPNGDMNKFFLGERMKIVRYLVWKYKISEQDAQGCFQNGCKALWENIHSGKLTKDNLSCALSTYLMRCCMNHATHLKEKSMRVSNMDFDDPENSALLRDCSDDAEGDVSMREEQLTLLENVVKDLPEPCRTILWSVYFNYREVEKQSRNGEKLMDVVAVMLGMKKTVLKTTKNRCMTKLKTRINSLLS